MGFEEQFAKVGKKEASNVFGNKDFNKVTKVARPLVELPSKKVTKAQGFDEVIAANKKGLPEKATKGGWADQVL